jgi:hypothetical protein
MKTSGRAACFITLLLLCGIFSFWYQSDSRSFQRAQNARILKSIDPEDRFCLDFYFRSLLFEDSLAYVLYGDKPMGFSGFYNPTITSDSPLEPGCPQKSLILKRGYELHKKYQSLFQQKNFIFVFRETDDYTEIALVNRRNFLRAVARSSEDFQKVLGAEVTGESILDQFIQEKEILGKPLRENHALLGILLGYGKKNSSTFHRKIEIMKSQREFHLIDKKDHLTPSPGFNSLNEELDSLDKRLLPMRAAYQEFSLMDLPAFMVDPYDLETQKVKGKFIKQRKKIIDIYRRGNFLEITLEHLNS